MRADFYSLSSIEPDTRWLFACHLLEKAHLKGHQVFVYCNNQHEAEMLDELLWTFKAESFIPHNLQGEGPSNPPPIQIGFKQAEGFSDILLNMAEEIPPVYNQFRRVMEIVCNDEKIKEIARIHYRFYREQQLDITTHNLTKF